jgi:hypothetical protein
MLVMNELYFVTSSWLGPSTPRSMMTSMPLAPMM